MNKKLLFTLTLSALLFTSCGQSGSKQDATTTDTTTTEAAAPEKVKIDENDAESLVAAFEQYADQYAAIIDKLNAAKPGSSEFEAASKEMTELSEELQAIGEMSETCPQLHQGAEAAIPESGHEVCVSFQEDKNRRVSNA